MPLPPSEQLQREWLTIIVIGATGSLSLSKIFPALRGLEAGRFLPRHTRILAAGRTQLTTEGFRKLLQAKEEPPFTPSASATSLDGASSITFAYDSWPPRPSPARFSTSSQSFLQLISYHQLEKGPGPWDGISGLVRAIEAIEMEQPGVPHHRFYYLALPEPHLTYPELGARLCAEGRSASGWTRLVLEKPFGRDAETCRALNASLAASFPEESLFRIDRYLGKEIVENLLVMRFANRLLAPIWNRDNVSNVQIIFKEAAGPDQQGRAAYFDGAGIIRDVLQSHLLQLLALIAMDRPASLDPEDVRGEKLKVLRQVRPISPDDVILGQYGPGTSEGRDRPAFRTVPGVDPNSRTPTFAMAIAYVNNERWDGVPFIIKAGKALNERKSEIRIQLKDVSGDIFAPGDIAATGRNELVLRMQPLEEMYLKFVVKEPGRGVRLLPAELELSQRWHQDQARKAAAGEAPRRAFERLLLDAMLGDQSNFIREDEMEASWTCLDAVLKAADEGRIPLHEYPYGSAGPDEANALRTSKGHVPSVYSSERDARSAAPWDGNGASSESLARGTSIRFLPGGSAQPPYGRTARQQQPPGVGAVAGAAAVGLSDFGRAVGGGGAAAAQLRPGAMRNGSGGAAVGSSGALVAELAKRAAAEALAPARVDEN